MSLGLRERQTRAVESLLLFNRKLVPSGGEGVQWKVLVYDEHGERVVSQLFNKGELRRHHVTLFVRVDKHRDAIPDAPAVYLLAPSPANARLLAADASRALYGAMHVNFVTPVPRPVLEDLAERTLASQCAGAITKVYDQHLDFVSLEDRLFSFHQPNTLSSLHDTTLRNEEVKQHIERIAQSLVCVVVTLGVVPVIRCPKGDQVSHEIATQVESHLRTLREQRHSALSDGAVGRGQSFHRPVLVICERTWDLTSSLRHPRTYQALCHDILGLNLNRVTCEVGEKRQVFDLDTKSDAFWRTQRFHDIPTVAEANEEQVQDLKQNARAVQQQDDSQAPLPSPDSAQQWSNAINMLPEMREKKKLADMHTNLLHGILTQMQARKFSEFFEMEDALAQRAQLSRQDRERLYGMLRDPECGTAVDKVRLAMLYLGSLEPSGVVDEMKEVESALSSVPDVDSRPLKQWAAMRSSQASSVPPLSAPQQDSKRSLFAMAESVGKHLATGVKSLVRSESGFVPLTQFVHTVLENSSAESNSHPYFDPRLSSCGNQPPANRRREPFRDAIVCVVGGANFVEWQCLSEYAKRPSSSGEPRSIVYGGTDIASPSQLLAQLSLLYNKHNPSQQQGE